MDDETFTFKIDAFTPDSFPMERLGEYISDLGAMLGEGRFVNFVGLEEGSTKIVHRVRKEGVPRVRETLRGIATGDAEPMKLRAYEALNKRLREDNASGEYSRAGEGAVILAFPGAKARPPAIIGPIEQDTTVDGVLIALGGRDNTVPVRLQAEVGIITCSATRDMARSLAPHLFGNDLRVAGTGRWVRHELCGWKLEQLKIQSFELLGRETLMQAVADLRAVDAEWDLGDFSED